MEETEFGRLRPETNGERRKRSAISATRPPMQPFPSWLQAPGPSCHLSHHPTQIPPQKSQGSWPVQGQNPGKTRYLPHSCPDITISSGLHMQRRAILKLTRAHQEREKRSPFEFPSKKIHSSTNAFRSLAVSSTSISTSNHYCVLRSFVSTEAQNSWICKHRPHITGLKPHTCGPVLAVPCLGPASERIIR
jgi:hypothetical protein